MPVLTASGYSYNPFPTQSPSVTPGDRYQRIQATPDAFGASVGRAVEGLGTTLGQASDRLADIAVKRQQLFNEVVADDQINQAEDRINKLMYGDPDTPGDTGFIGKRGKNALDAFPAVRKQIDDIINQTRSNLQNQQQQQRFDQSTRRYKNAMMNESGRHYDRQFTQFEADTAQARMKLNAGNVARESAEGNWSGFRGQLGQGLLDIERLGKTMGKAPEVIEAEKQAFTRSSAKEWAESLSVKDAFAAQQFIENNKAELGELYPDLAKSVRARATQQQAMELATGKTISRPSQRVMVRGDAGERIAATLANRGWSQSAIIGAINNAITESSLNPDARGAGGEEGLFQFHPSSHLTPFKQRYGGDTSVEAQTNYMADEVERTLPGYKDIGDASTATRRFMKEFERPKDQSETAINARIANGSASTKIVGGMKPEVTSEPEKLLKDMPPPEEGELPDAQVPNLSKQIEEMAKRAPADITPEVWWAAVKLKRQMANLEYAGEQQKIRAEKQRQDKLDDEVSNEYISRIGTDNPPDVNKIFVDPRLSPDAKMKLGKFITAELMPGPPPRVAADNEAKMFNRIYLPDSDPDRISTEGEIRDGLIQRLYGRAEYDRLIKDFRDRQGTGGKEFGDLKKTVIAGALKTLWPQAQFSREMAMMSDPEGALREQAFRRYIDAKEFEYRTAGKNPLDLLDPTKPDYVGKPEVVQQFGKGPPGSAKSLQDTSRPEPKNMNDVRAAWQAGAYGPYGSDEARVKAYEDAVKRGFIKPKLEAPVR